jgi:hypothetical protein
MKNSEAKEFVKIFCKTFLIKKKYFCLSNPGLIFIFLKKGFLNFLAVRIRVKIKIFGNVNILKMYH